MNKRAAGDCIKAQITLNKGYERYKLNKYLPKSSSSCTEKLSCAIKQDRKKYEDPKHNTSQHLSNTHHQNAESNRNLCQ